MYKETIKKSFIGGLVFAITAFGVVYAANITSVQSQTINSGDIMGKGWFQDVNDKLSAGITKTVIIGNVASNDVNSASKTLYCSDGIAAGLYYNSNGDVVTSKLNQTSCKFDVDAYDSADIFCICLK